MNALQIVASPNGMPLFYLSIRRYIILLMMVVGISIEGRAQSHRQAWMAAPEADSCSQVMFQRTFNLEERPRRAWITIATTGTFDVYINQRNVSRCIRLPLRSPYSTVPIATTLDAKQHLRAGRNTICITYASTYYYKDSLQLSVTLYGDYASGESFLIDGDEDWLCRPTNRALTADGRERHDATKWGGNWADEDIDIACWTPVRRIEPTDTQAIEYQAREKEGESVVHVSRPRFFNAVGDSIVYDFGHAFHGFVRITLRGCRRGERINIDGLEYTCSGEEDEQAFRKITTTDRRRITVSGDSDFRRDQIQLVEAVEVGTTRPRFGFR